MHATPPSVFFIEIAISVTHKMYTIQKNSVETILRFIIVDSIVTNYRKGGVSVDLLICLCI